MSGRVASEAAQALGTDTETVVTEGWLRGGAPSGGTGRLEEAGARADGSSAVVSHGPGPHAAPTAGLVSGCRRPLRFAPPGREGSGRAILPHFHENRKQRLHAHWPLFFFVIYCTLWKMETIPLRKNGVLITCHLCTRRSAVTF